MTSLLEGLSSFMKKKIPSQMAPDIKTLAEKIRTKSEVLYFPVSIEPKVTIQSRSSLQGPLTIVWNHRWEFDKRPDIFFSAIYQLMEAKLPFRLIVMGEHFAEIPPIFEEAKKKIEEYENSLENKENCPIIKRWGYAATKQEYYEILANEGDVLVSTTDHEFLGISVIEGIVYGCYPLCPNKLVFPEYIPAENLYNTEGQLVKKLRYFCKYPEKLRNLKWKIDLAKFDMKKLAPLYLKHFFF